MIFKSSEIRWFSQDKDLLWDFYKNLTKRGEGNREPDRTDYYLRSGTINTGIKIREGNHELKVKCGEDEKLNFGTMEHWMKWSTSEEKNILNTIEGRFLAEWIAVKKKRFKKRYEIVDGEELKYLQGEFVDEGCGVEFTEIQLERLNEPIFTVGFEAFSENGRQRENLLSTIKMLDIDFSPFEEFDSYGYPQLLHRISEELT